jgi:glycosyltransferase involved in cell wall biosynthesis
VLFVAEAFGGGMFEITRMQAEGMAALGWQTAIAFGRRPETPDRIDDAVAGSVELFPLPWMDRTIKAQWRAQRELRRLIRAWRPDVIHLMSSFAGLHGALAEHTIPTVYTPQAYSFTMSGVPWQKRWAYLLAENFVASRVTAVGACSLSEGEHARTLPGTRAVAVVPNGIDELRRDRLNSGLGSRRKPTPVVAMGRLSPQRRPEACARILVAAGIAHEAVWIGGAPSGSPVASALDEAGIQITGWLPRAETLSLLSQSLIYLHWTAWDGLPLSVLEAMSLDVVVVASDIGPNREVLGPEQVCRTEAQAAELITLLLTDEELRAQFIANQHARRGNYGSDAMVEGWERLYQEIM